MYPILCKLGPFTLYSYGAMLVAALLTATTLACRAARRLPPEWVAITPEEIVDFSCLSLVGGILGGRVFYLALHWDLVADSPWEAVAIWHGGLIWYGGFLGGLLAGWLYVRAKRLHLLRVLDQYIPFLAIGQAIGRVGCFLNGCCYGKPTASWLGVRFPSEPVPVLPTQLFESAGLVFLYILLRRLQRPAMLRHPGRLFGCYLLFYAVLRFALEFLRGDQAPWWLGLTLQQLISLVVFLFGLFFSTRHPPPATRD